MKKNLYLILLVAIISCKKNSDQKITAESQTDSLNKIIERKNDSITKINNENLYEDWSGGHKLTHNSMSKKGEINFKKIEHYQF